jgi:hypothetical protein
MPESRYERNGRPAKLKNTGGLPPLRSRHFAAITEPAQLGQLLRDIRDYHGHFITRCALRLRP